MTFMNTSFQVLMKAAAFSPFSPRAMMAIPIKRAMTMTWSIFALVSGARKLEGNRSTSIFMGPGLAFLTLKARSAVDSTGNRGLKLLAMISPMVVAMAVVKK